MLPVPRVGLELVGDGLELVGGFVGYLDVDRAGEGGFELSSAIADVTGVLFDEVLEAGVVTSEVLRTGCPSQEEHGE